MNIVKFNPEDYAKSSCSTEFYKSVELFDSIKAGFITDVYQMKINPGLTQQSMSSCVQTGNEIRSLRDSGKIKLSR